MASRHSDISRATLHGGLSTSFDAAPPRPRWHSLSPPLVSGIVRAVDAIAIVVASLLIYPSYIGPPEGWERESLQPYISITALNIVLVLQAFTIAGLYRFDALIRPSRHFIRMAVICIGCAAILAAVATSLNELDGYLKHWASVGLMMTISVTFLGRLLVFMAIHDLGIFTRRIIVYGAEEHSRRLLQELRRNDEPWNEVLGVFDDRARGLGHVEGYPVLGGSDELVALAHKHEVDEVLVAIPWDCPERTKALLERLKVLPVSVRLAPTPITSAYPGSRLSLRYGMPLVSVLDKPLAGPDAVVKELSDKALSLLLLLTCAPLLLLIAAAIKLDSPGPAFFVQRRYGFNSQLIGVWKFRTMYRSEQDDYADQLTTLNDPRVTRVGAFLRRTSFDELPQLFNVVTGEMSLVGPRPHALHAKAAGKLYEHVVAEYAARHKVKPGITGWAQVNGWRGETDTEEKILKRVDHDLYYIDNWSLILDLRILLLTVPAVLSGRHSY